MKILTLENTVFSLTNLPDDFDEDIRFAVLDNSDPKDPDFFFIPLIFLESFSSPAIVLNIDGFEVTMPVDWHMAVGDSHSGNDLEVLPLTSINNRGFETFLFNPLTSFQCGFADIEVVNFYNDVKWYFPKMINGQLLAIPIEDKENPRCAYFVKDINKQSELIDYGKIL